MIIYKYCINRHTLDFAIKQQQIYASSENFTPTLLVMLETFRRSGLITLWTSLGQIFPDNPFGLFTDCTIFQQNSGKNYPVGLTKSFQPWNAVPAFQRFQIAWSLIYLAGYSLVFSTIPWFFLIFPGIPLYSLIFICNSWCALVFPTICSISSYYLIYPFIPFPGVPWYFLIYLTDPV